MYLPYEMLVMAANPLVIFSRNVKWLKSKEETFVNPN